MMGGETEERERRADTVRGFAGELRRLRESAGNPSFRKMAGTSGFISHTTLHEAAGGTRFASWETTREFVRACGGDETEWRTRWERARDGLAARPPVAATAVSAVQERGNRRRLMVAVIVVAVLLLGVATLLVMVPGAGTDSAVPPAGPAVPGDGSRFIGDITIPDGSSVELGETFVKVWEIQNSGTVVWRQRFLQRDDLPASPDGCRTPDRIPVGDTLPNERVKISVTVTAPNKAATCMVKWKMVDPDGRQFFPTARPIYFLVHAVDSAQR